MLLSLASHAGLFRALCDLLPEQDSWPNTCFVPDGFKRTLPAGGSIFKVITDYQVFYQSKVLLERHRPSGKAKTCPYKISSTFANTEVNNVFSIYHASGITSGPKLLYVSQFLGNLKSRAPRCAYQRLQSHMITQVIIINEVRRRSERNHFTRSTIFSNKIPMYLDPRLCNQRGGSISNLKCFLLLFVYSEVNITYSIYLLLRGFPINCS